MTTADLRAPEKPTVLRRGPSRLRRRESAAAWVLITPFVVLFLLFLVVPIVYSGYLSLFREQLVGGNTFVGLENYTRALTDPSFLSGVARMALFLLIQVPVMLGLSLVFALLLDAGVLYLQKVVRLGIFIPYAVPSVIAALMWGYLYGPDFGPFAQLADKLGTSAPPFLSADWMLFSLMNIVSWEFIGYNMIILYAALRSVPRELFDAAAVDGAGTVRTAWSIKIPAIRPAILLTVIFSVIGSFQLFNEPSILRNLAPNVIGIDYTPNLYAYNLAFINRDSNYAAAIAFILGIVIMVVSYTVQLSAQRKERAAR
ncbi:ABC transporter permease [Cellulomonas chitinilytica]|uniref:ABC transporter permease n=1 Tax=Cellulomonas chitinilytica TaxID=398759 RepID=A0A919P4V1_9CELL|nr:sugar ABC transporter permease [Cellulomonas chitinilytica]GIG23268.1 ABC transporter permease [Cellulomonas chitinilytica]